MMENKTSGWGRFFLNKQTGARPIKVTLRFSVYSVLSVRKIKNQFLTESTEYTEVKK
jgi:hypothetical protein